MQRFAALYERLDSTTSTNEKVAAMAEYFRAVPASDGAWALFFLMGLRLKRPLSGRLLARWVRDEAGLSDWLFLECYTTVGDLGETIALLLDGRAAQVDEGVSLREWFEDRVMMLRTLDPSEQRAQVLSWLLGLGRTERMLLVKVLTGSLRVGVSRTLVERALAQASEQEPSQVSHRLMGDWKPTGAFFESLMHGGPGATSAARPYPFFLASPLEGPGGADLSPETLGSIDDWQVEWKWDGIRAQLIKREGVITLWSRGEEVITERFPEVIDAAARLPEGVVLDGEVLAWNGGPDGRPLPFADLQKRIGRVQLTRRVLAAAAAVMLAYDLLEVEGRDVRSEALRSRRRMLEELLGRSGGPKLFAAAVLTPATWEQAAELRSQARKRGVEGLMLKRKASAYGAGRTKGDWWKWKVDPFTFDGVLVYAEPGHGRRANLLTDYTFAVWDAGELVPVAKAYSGLSNEEIAELERWIRRHSPGRHGPVRVVEPTQVFELAFEKIAESPRHRSGVAMRFPRILRWRHDKPAAEADTLERLRGLIERPRTQDPTLFD